MTVFHRSWRDPRLLVLYPVFALSGVADVITGPMLPSLARTFNLSDSRSDNLLFLIFADMATGALLCRGFYLQILKFGPLALALECVGPLGSSQVAEAVRTACFDMDDLTPSMELARELIAAGVEGLVFPSVVDGDDNLVVYRANCGGKAFSLGNEREVIDQVRRIAGRHK